MGWTRFWDMRSGGSQKESWEFCYIEAPEKEARSVFFARFGHSPDRVSCTCCGEDYAVEESGTLERSSAYHRDCKWDKAADTYDVASGQSLDEYLASDTVCVIHAADIKPEERVAEVPEQGFVWKDG